MQNTNQVKAILAAREQRWQARQALVGRFGAPLLTLCMNIPGSYKNLPGLTRAFTRLWTDMQTLHMDMGVLPLFTESGKSADGPWAQLVSPLSASQLKRLALNFEDTHPLGRLADADVLDARGAPLSRLCMGFAPRSCFVCNDSAALCRRSSRHTQEELLLFVRGLLTSRLPVAAAQGE